MLTLTENASTIVKTIAEQSGDTEGGLRFSAQNPGEGSLAVAPAPGPQPGDEVVERDGARVFLEETAAVALSDQVLDAQVDPAGSVQFSIAPQA